MVPPITSLSTATPQGELGTGWGCCRCADRVAKHCSPYRVWLYVDDRLQQMKPHQGPPPRPQPQPQPEGPYRLLLGGLGASNTIRNFSGCITNVFVKRCAEQCRGAVLTPPAQVPPAADCPHCPHRLTGPQRVLDLQQNVGGINVSSGCAPAAPGTQTPVQAPRGLQATVAQKVGSTGVGGETRAGGEGKGREADGAGSGQMTLQHPRISI